MTGDSSTISITSFHEKGTIQYGIGNVELVQECFPKHSRIGKMQVEGSKYEKK